MATDPYYSKVLTLFERLAAEDNNTRKELFRPDAECVVWYGKFAGLVGRPEHAEPFPTAAGPVQYWNRVQYFGDHVFAETHTVTFADEARCRADRFGTSFEALAVCTLDDDGYIVRFEEFLDHAFMVMGQRPVPAPQRPPTEVERYMAPGNAGHNKQLMRELFDKMMLFEDQDQLFTADAQAGQMFAKTNWEGKCTPVTRGKSGKLKLGGPERPIYTNRRLCAGDGWAIELHTVTCSLNAEQPEQRYRGEVAVLTQVDSSTGKVKLLLEFGEPGAFQRVEDFDGRAKL